MSIDSFKYYYCLYIWYCIVFSGKLAMATGHAMLLNLQCQPLKTCTACPVAMASFTTGTDRLQLCQLYIQKQEVISIEGIHIKSPMPRK
jgi:hypothetical protein